MLDKLLLVAAWDRLIAWHREREREFWLGLQAERQMRHYIAENDIGSQPGDSAQVEWRLAPRVDGRIEIQFRRLHRMIGKSDWIAAAVICSDGALDVFGPASDHDWMLPLGADCLWKVVRLDG